MTTQGAGPRSSGGRTTGLTLGALAVLGVLVVAAIVIGLNLVGRPDGSPAAVGTPSPTGAGASPTDSTSPSPTSSGTVRPPTAPDLAWQRLDGALDGNGVTVMGVTNISGRWFATGSVGQAAAIWASDEDAPRAWTTASLDSVNDPGFYAQVTHVLPDADNLLAFGSWGAVGSEQYSWITWRSTDGGATWKESRRDEAALRTVTEGGAGFIGAGWKYGGTTPFDSFISTSADGITWVRTEPAAMRNSEVVGMAAIGDRLVAVGSAFAEDGSLVAAAWYSDDQGGTWTAGDTGGEVGTLYDVAPLGQGLVAVGGSGTPTAWLTDDGITWQPYPMGEAATAFTVSAMEAGGVVAVGNAGPQDTGPEHAWSSLDGITWVDGGELDQPSSGLVMASAAYGRAVVAGGSCPGGSACATPLWLGLPKE
jgi:hypothetical protein